MAAHFKVPELLFMRVGTLLSVDGSMNMALSGVKDVKTSSHDYPFSFIRGNNVQYVRLL